MYIYSTKHYSHSSYIGSLFACYPTFGSQLKHQHRQKCGQYFSWSMAKFCTRIWTSSYQQWHELFFCGWREWVKVRRKGGGVLSKMKIKGKWNERKKHVMRSNYFRSFCKIVGIIVPVHSTNGTTTFHCIQATHNIFFASMYVCTGTL